MVVIDKKELRKEVRAKLHAMTTEAKDVASCAIVSSVREHIVVSGAKVVALFSPLHDEPQISELITELSSVMTVALPRVEGDVMQFYFFSAADMHTGAYGINEPCNTPLVEPWEIDLMLVPGVAFTCNGARMGRGKGYYDKYMSQEGFRAHKIGVCYAVQVVENLPQEEHDIKMDTVIYK